MTKINKPEMNQKSSRKRCHVNRTIPGWSPRKNFLQNLGWICDCIQKYQIPVNVSPIQHEISLSTDTGTTSIPAAASVNQNVVQLHDMKCLEEQLSVSVFLKWIDCRSVITSTLTLCCFCIHKAECNKFTLALWGCCLSFCETSWVEIK